MNIFERQRSFNFEALLKSNDISPPIQKHLSTVFTLLALTVLSASIGALVHVETHLGGTVTFLLSVGFMVWLATEQNKFYTEKRVGILLGFGFFKGMSIGGLIELALHIDSSLIVTALVGTTAVFACFALAAMVSPRRSYLYLGATLGSAISLLFWGSIVNIFFNSYFFFNVQLYAGLLIFVGYVVYDTQLIIEKAGAGSKDVCWDAAELFIDFVAIFVRILIILLKNSQEKKDKKRNNRA